MCATDSSVKYGHNRGGGMQMPEFGSIFIERFDACLDAKVATGFQERIIARFERQKKWIIAPEASEVARRIFTLAIEGKGVA